MTLVQVRYAIDENPAICLQIISEESTLNDLLHKINDMKKLNCQYAYLNRTQQSLDEKLSSFNLSKIIFVFSESPNPPSDEFLEAIGKTKSDTQSPTKSSTSEKITIKFSLLEDQSRIFNVEIPPDSNISDFLTATSKLTGRSFNYAFLNGEPISNSASISKFDTNSSLFFVSENSQEVQKPQVEKAETKIKIRYSIIPEIKTYLIVVPSRSTILDFKTAVETKQKRTFNYVFYDDKLLDLDQKLRDYTNSESIFFFSNDRTIDLNYIQEVKEMTARSQKRSRSSTTSLSSFIFYCTGSPVTFFNGIEVELDLQMTPETCASYLLSKLIPYTSIDNKQLIVYLHGGIPFLGGTLDKIHEYKNQDKGKCITKRKIYGILTRSIPNSILTNSYSELSRISNSDKKLLFSPQCDQTPRGMADMTCLVGYLNHYGIFSEDLVIPLAQLTDFSPLITSLNRFIHRLSITGLDIVTFCSSMHSFFRSFLPESIPENRIFEYAFPICNIIFRKITPISGVSAKLFDNENELYKFFNLPKEFFVYCSDDSFSRQQLSITQEDWDTANDSSLPFTPVLPYSLYYVTGATIVQGRDHNYLYLQKTVDDSQKVDILDPLTGVTTSYEVETFAEQEGLDEHYKENIIDIKDVKQIVFICIDESLSIKNQGLLTFEYQFVTSFADLVLSSNIPTILGLISFGSKVIIRCPLTPWLKDLDLLQMTSIESSSETANLTCIYDAISCAINKLIDFNSIPGSIEKRFPKAVMRVITISDGQTNGSSTLPLEVAVQIKTSNVILDSFIVGNNEYEGKMLACLSHLSGGKSFLPTTTEAAIQLLEQASFLDYELRRPDLTKCFNVNGRKANYLHVKINDLAYDFLRRSAHNATFDTEDTLSNKVIDSFAGNSVPLTLPNFICYRNSDNKGANFKIRRLLKELRLAYIITTQHPSNPNYDPDIKIYISRADLSRWKVFIKGSKDTPYENKWWELIVIIPPLYPSEKPKLIFVTIPYHINVSVDGRICYNLIENSYYPGKRIVDILQEIKILFIAPDPDFPINTDAIRLYQNNQQAYNESARQSAAYAKSDYHEYLEGSYIDDAVPQDYQISFDEYLH